MVQSNAAREIPELDAWSTNHKRVLSQEKGEAAATIIEDPPARLLPWIDTFEAEIGL